MEQRIKILKDANLISNEICDKIVNIYIKYFSNFERTDILDSFITHLSIALERMNKKESIEKLDEFIINDLKSKSNYNEVVKFWEDIEKKERLNLSFEEKEYIYLHLINILTPQTLLGVSNEKLSD